MCAALRDCRLWKWREHWVDALNVTRKTYFWHRVVIKRQHTDTQVSFCALLVSNMQATIKFVVRQHKLNNNNRDFLNNLMRKLTSNKLSIAECANQTLSALVAAKIGHNQLCTNDFVASGIVTLLTSHLTCFPSDNEFVNTIILTILKHIYIPAKNETHDDVQLEAVLVHLNRYLNQTTYWLSMSHEQHILVLTVLVNIATLGKRACELTLYKTDIVKNLYASTNNISNLTQQEHAYLSLWLHNLLCGSSDPNAAIEHQCGSFLVNLTHRYDIDTTSACKTIANYAPKLLNQVIDHWITHVVTYIADYSSDVQQMHRYALQTLACLFAHPECESCAMLIQLLFMIVSLQPKLDTKAIRTQYSLLYKILQSSPTWVIDNMLQELMPSQQHKMCLFLELDALRVVLFECLEQSTELLSGVADLLSQCALRDPIACDEKIVTQTNMEYLEKALRNCSQREVVLEKLFYFWYNMFQMFKESKSTTAFFAFGLKYYHNHKQWGEHATCIMLKVTQRIPTLLPRFKAHLETC